MPKRAKGTRKWRINRAVHLWMTTNMTQTEIGDELGVSRETVNRYIHDPPADEVRETLTEQARQVRLSAFQELQRQLREAGERSRSAEKPVKVWTDDDGDLTVKDKRDPETGEKLGVFPLPDDMEMGADEQARYYSRGEIRDILEMLIDLVGAAEPDEVELSGAVESGLSDEAAETLDRLSDSLEGKYGDGE